MWQGATVSWASTKQASTALSTCEAEIYALSEGAKYLVYFRKFLSELGVVVGHRPVRRTIKGRAT